MLLPPVEISMNYDREENISRSKTYLFGLQGSREWGEREMILSFLGINKAFK